MNNEEFKALGLSKQVLTSIDTLGYKEPSKIQKGIIPLILDHYDVIGQAQTGTGKTLAYAASVLSMMNVKTNVVKAIILTPTRELALQVSEEFESLNRSSKFNILAVFGGSSIENQMRALRRGVDIVVGTPGRVMDLMKRNVLRIDDLEFFVLDEADEMLNMGFAEDIETIFKKTNKEKQVLLFSATMPKGILKLASRYMKPDYQHIAIEEKTKTSTSVKQYYYLVSEKIRSEAICRVLDAKDPSSAIIFCQTKREVDQLLTELTKRNYSVEAMHGDIAQATRIQTLERFKQGAFKYLIATDVAARGIHVDNISCVINYNLPQDVESYIHRIGRTGRANQVGEAITFITPRQTRFLDELKRIAKCTVEKKEIPNETEIFETKYHNILERVQEIMEKKEYESYMKYVRDYNKEDSLHFSASLLKVIFEKELGSELGKELTMEKQYRPVSKDGTVRVFLTIGKLDNVKKGSLIDFLKAETKIDKSCYGNIEILTKFTFLDVDGNVVDDFIKKLYNKRMNGRVIRAEKAKQR